MGSTSEGKTKDFWDKLQAIGPALVAAAVTCIGVWYKYQQAELHSDALVQQTYTEIVAQREKSDNDIRAQMFTTLIDSLFGKLSGPLDVDVETNGEMHQKSLMGGHVLNASEKASDVGREERLEYYKKRIMFLNLLVHNFETVDIKPLFTSFDRELSALADTTEQSDYFQLREELRDIGRYIALRQANALAAAEDTRVQRFEFQLKKSEEGEAIKTITFSNGENDSILVEVIAHELGDGFARIRIEPSVGPGQKLRTHATAGDQDFNVTFYDAPYIDNTRLISGARVALILTRSIEVNKLLDHPDWRIVDLELQDLEEYRKEGIRSLANVTLLQFPPHYTALRDRPYVEKIVQDLNLKDTGLQGGQKHEPDSRN